MADVRPMNPVPENELLSAYLDGELTADEQAQVEQLLAASPAARQLVDELRALRVRLQALAPRRIGKDISQEVLRRAQLRMESEAAPPRPRREEEQESPQPARPFPGTLLGRALQPRALVWSGLAVSVAVVLLVVELSRGPDGRPVAVRTPSAQGESAAAPTEADLAADSGAADEMAGARRALGEEMFEEEHARGRRAYGFGRGEPSEPAPEAVMDAPRATATAPPTAREADESAVVERPASSPLVAKGAEEGLAGFRMRAGEYGKDVGGLPGGYGVTQKTAPSAGEEPGVGGRYTGTAREAKDAEGGAGRFSVANGAPDALLGRGADRAPALLVMRCNATPKAVPVFGTLLDKQQITLAQAPGSRGAPVYGLKTALAMGKGYENEQRLDEELAEGTNQVTFDFEATPDQLAALVTDLNGRPEEFSPISYVLPGPGGVSPGLADLAGTREALGQGVDDESAYGGARLMRKPARDIGPKKNGRGGQEDPFAGRMLSGRAEAGQQAEGEQRAAKAEDQRSKLSHTLEDAAESEAEGKLGVAEMSLRPEGPPSRGQPRQQLQSQMPAAPQAKPPAPTKAGEKGGVPAEEAVREESREEEEAEADVREGARERLRAARRAERSPAPPSSRQHAELPAPATQVGQPALPHQLGQRDQVAAKYQVRFVLHILGPEIPAAAAVAKDSAEAAVPAEKAARMTDADEAPPAGQSKRATVDP